MTKEDIIIFFRETKCENCPFKTECDNMYQVIRRYTADETFDLCTVISGRISYYV